MPNAWKPPTPPRMQTTTCASGLNQASSCSHVQGQKTNQQQTTRNAAHLRGGGPGDTKSDIGPNEYTVSQASPDTAGTIPSGPHTANTNSKTTTNTHMVANTQTQYDGDVDSNKKVPTSSAGPASSRNIPMSPPPPGTPAPATGTVPPPTTGTVPPPATGTVPPPATGTVPPPTTGTVPPPTTGTPPPPPQSGGGILDKNREEDNLSRWVSRLSRMEGGAPPSHETRVRAGFKGARTKAKKKSTRKRRKVVKHMKYVVAGQKGRTTVLKKTVKKVKAKAAKKGLQTEKHTKHVKAGLQSALTTSKAKAAKKRQQTKKHTRRVTAGLKSALTTSKNKTRKIKVKAAKTQQKMKKHAQNVQAGLKAAATRARHQRMKKTKELKKLKSKITMGHKAALTAANKKHSAALAKSQHVQQVSTVKALETMGKKHQQQVKLLHSQLTKQHSKLHKIKQKLDTHQGTVNYDKVSFKNREAIKAFVKDVTNQIIKLSAAKKKTSLTDDLGYKFIPPAPRGVVRSVILTPLLPSVRDSSVTPKPKAAITRVAAARAKKTTKLASATTAKPKAATTAKAKAATTAKAKAASAPVAKAKAATTAKPKAKKPSAAAKKVKKMTKAVSAPAAAVTKAATPAVAAAAAATPLSVGPGTDEFGLPNAGGGGKKRLSAKKRRKTKHGTLKNK